VTVPNFDAAEVPEPIRFRFLGRDWECYPVPPDQALAVALMGRDLIPYAETAPEAYAEVASDIAVRFVRWCVTDPVAWIDAVRAQPVPGLAVIEVMSYVVNGYSDTTPAPVPEPMTPSPSRAAARRTDLAGLERVLDTVGVRGPVIRER
jgi:hypothetical protein